MAAKSISHKDVLPKYTGLLDDINNCLELIEELENERTVGQWISDWQVGERNSINFERMVHNLKGLKRELEYGNKLYNRYFINVDGANKIQKKYEKQLESVISHSEIIEFKKGCSDSIQPDLDAFSNAVSTITSHTVFQAIENKCSTLAKVTSGVIAGGVVAAGTAGAGVMAITAGLVTMSVATGGILLLSGLFGIIGSMAYTYSHSKGKSRGIQYQEVKALYDQLHDNKVLALLQTHHKKVEAITEGIGAHKEKCKELYEIHTSSPTPTIDNKREKTITMIIIDLILAIILYSKTCNEEFEELTVTEPDLSKESRNRMAARTAVKSCKAFLKYKLSYSDSEVDLIIKLMLSCVKE